MDKKMIYALVVVVIVVIAVVFGGGYLLGWFGGGGNGGNGGPTTVYTMGNATSLQYTVDLTTAGVVGTYKFAGRNLGTASIELRVDANPVVVDGTTYSYIMFAGNQTSWNNETGTWGQGNFMQDWGVTWSPQWSSYIAHDADWKAGDDDITYTDDSGNEVLIYDIVVNPTLPDSLFKPPS
jgi:hypothetical protein